MTAIHTYRWPVLLAIYALLVAVAHLIVLPSAAYTAHPGIVGTALFFDLTIWPMLGLYWLIARPKQWAAGRLVLSAVVLIRLAMFWLPRLPISDWALTLGGLEVLILGSLVFRLRTISQTYRLLRRTQDAEKAGQGALNAVFGERFTRLIWSEGAIIYYALLNWHRKQVLPANAVPLTTHRESGQLALLIGLLGISSIELVAAHLLLVHWFPAVANWVTLLSGYGCLLLLAVINTAWVRPSYLTPDNLHLRLDLRWQAVIPRHQIAATTPIFDKKPGAFNLALLTSPNLLLTLNEPVQLTGLYGIRKTVTQLTLFVDKREIVLRNLKTH